MVKIIVKHYVNITSECNLNCSFCFRNKTKYNLNIENIKSKISKISKDDYLVLYGGEPTLKPEIINEIRENTYAKLILVTNGLNYNYIKNNINKFNTVQVSIYKGFEDMQIETINNLNCYSHIVLCSEILNDFEFLSKVLNNINPKNKIWISLDLTMKDNYDNRIKIDKFIDFISKFCNETYKHIFLKDVKDYPGRECDHLYNNSMYINTDGLLHNCSHSIKKTVKCGRCCNCDNIYCRACVCEIPIIDRNVQCYFYNKVRLMYENGLF